MTKTLSNLENQTPQEKVLEALRESSVKKLKLIYATLNFDIDAEVDFGKTALYLATRHIRSENLPVIMFLLNQGANPLVALGPNSQETLERTAFINLWENALNPQKFSAQEKELVFQAFKLAHKNSQLSAQENTKYLILTVSLMDSPEREKIINYFLSQPLDFSYILNRQSGPMTLFQACFNSSSTNVWVAQKLATKLKTKQEQEAFLKAYNRPLYYDTENRHKLNLITTIIADKLKFDSHLLGATDKEKNPMKNKL